MSTDRHAELKGIVLRELSYLRKQFTFPELCRRCGAELRGERAAVRNVLYRMHDAGLVLLVKHDRPGNRWVLRWYR